jgi:hypothetical protein
MQRTLALLTLALLAGCAVSPPLNLRPTPDLRPWAEQIRAQCSSQPTHLAAERCANPTIVARYISEGHVDPDIARTYVAKREDIAARWDQGAITGEQAAAEFSDLNRRANALQHQRNAARNAAAADALADTPTIDPAPYQPMHIDMPSAPPPPFVAPAMQSPMPPGGYMPNPPQQTPAQIFLNCAQQHSCAGVGE